MELFDPVSHKSPLSGQPNALMFKTGDANMKRMSVTRLMDGLPEQLPNTDRKQFDGNHDGAGNDLAKWSTLGSTMPNSKLNRASQCNQAVSGYNTAANIQASSASINGPFITASTTDPNTDDTTPFTGQSENIAGSVICSREQNFFKYRDTGGIMALSPPTAHSQLPRHLEGYLEQSSPRKQALSNGPIMLGYREQTYPWEKHAETSALYFEGNSRPIRRACNVTEAWESDSPRETSAVFSINALSPSAKDAYICYPPHSNSQVKLVQGIIGRENIQRGLVKSAAPPAGFYKNTLEPVSLAAPIQLLHVNKVNGKEIFQLSDVAKEWLLSQGNKRVITIGFCGEHLVGKSYLANLFMGIGEAEKGFALNLNMSKEHSHDNAFSNRSPWLQSAEGTWMMARKMAGDDALCLFLDFEGSGNPVKTVEHDTRIFTLAILICSYLLYNTKGPIQDEDILGLSIISDTEEVLSSKSENFNEDENALKIFPASSVESKSLWRAPKFLWMLRDFSYLLYNELEQRVTAKYYMETTLQYNNSHHPNEEVNRELPPAIRKITNTFQCRDCEVLNCPSLDPSKLKDLSTTKLIDLQEEFLSQVELIRDKVLGEAKDTKSFKDNLTCAGFYKLMERLIDRINNHAKINPTEVWDNLQKWECTQAQSTALREFQSDMEAKREQLPMNTTTLIKQLKEVKDKHVKTYKQNAIGDPDTIKRYKQCLKINIDAAVKDFIAQNENLASDKNRKKFDNIVEAKKKKYSNKLIGEQHDVQALLDEIAEEYNAEIIGSERLHYSILDERRSALFSKDSEAYRAYFKERESLVARLNHSENIEQELCIAHQRCKELENKTRKMKEDCFREANEFLQKTIRKDCAYSFKDGSLTSRIREGSGEYREYSSQESKFRDSIEEVTRQLAAPRQPVREDREHVTCSHCWMQ